MNAILMCGCYRSGTTIAVRMLNRHPEIIFTNELQTYNFQSERSILARILAKNAEHIFPETKLTTG